ncbi:nucleoside phosphorylase domain-containing protein [Aspergillus californicus]
MALTHEDYTVGWICALPLELTAAKLMLDDVHPTMSQVKSDHNTYVLGRIGGHNVAIVCLPSGVYGTTSAAVVVAQMVTTFPALQFGLMVGIGGGVPGPTADIRLGDVVIGTPTPGSAGVVQYDYGKALRDGRFQQTGTLNKPAQVLLTAISQIRSEYMVSDAMANIMSSALEDNLEFREGFSRPERDWLFKAGYDHEGSNSDCSACDQGELQDRSELGSNVPCVHYGLIASGNQVIKDGQKRDLLARDMAILCFEMEAAGLMDLLPCLVMRGICDYCDSHKQKSWQRYAALAAAAYAKILLGKVPVYGNPRETEKRRLDWGAPSPEKLERIKRILQPSVHSLDIYESIGKRRVSGTGDWIRREKPFEAWIGTGSSPLLWVCGSPGTGKTFIAHNVLSYLQELSHIDTQCHSNDDIASIHAAWRVLFYNYYTDKSQPADCKLVLVLDGVDESFEEDRRTFAGAISRLMDG